MTPDLFDRRSFLKIGSLSVFGSLAWGEIARLRAQTVERSKKEISVIVCRCWLGRQTSTRLSDRPRTSSASMNARLIWCTADMSRSPR